MTLNSDKGGWAWAGREAVTRLGRSAFVLLGLVLLLGGGAIRARGAMQVFVDEAPAEAVLTTTGGTVGLRVGAYYAAEAGTVRTPEDALGPTVLVWRESGLVIVIEPGSELVFTKLVRERQGLWRTVGYDLEVRLNAGAVRFVSSTDANLPTVRLLVVAGDVALVKASEKFVVSVALQERTGDKLEALVQVAEGAAQVTPASAVASAAEAQSGAAVSFAVSAGEIARVGQDGRLETGDAKVAGTLSAGPAAAGSGGEDGSAEARAWREVADEARQNEAEVAANPVSGALPATTDQEQAVSPSTFNPN